jgi:uncharacterized protein YxeA
MKKVMLVILVAIMIANIDATAQVKSVNQNYVVTTDGTYYFAKVRYGLSGFLVATDQNGTKKVFSKNEVKAYQKNGRLFESVTFTGKSAPEFAELVANRNGVKVYRSSNADVTNNAYLFKGQSQIMQVSQENLAYVLNFLNDNQGK